ncbi:MAG: ribose 5-phosphate isomerase A [Desulfatibacillaceae bacterium]
MSTNEHLHQAIRSAVSLIESGMVVGLGSGPTAAIAVNCIGDLYRKGEIKDIVAIPSSITSEDNVRSWDIPVSGFKDHSRIDIVIDGACEVDSDLNLIKTDGTFLQEKVLAQASERNVYIVPEKAVTDKVGMECHIPVEVAPFARETAQAYLESLGAVVLLRTNVISKAFRTVHHNLVLDAEFGPIDDPGRLSARLLEHAGVVQHGLFMGLATDVFVADASGARHLRRDR